MFPRIASIAALTLTAACATQPAPAFGPPPPPPPIDAAIDSPPPPIDAPVRPDGAVDQAQRALGEQYAARHGIKLYSYHRKHIGNHDGIFASMIAMPDGSLVVVGTKVTPRRGRAGISAAVAMRFEPDGAVRWQRDFARKGFPESEGGSVARLDDGFAVFVLEYVNPAWGAVSRVIRFGDDGTVRWDWLGRGRGSVDTPFADVLQVSPTRTITINGHIYVTKGTPAHDWRGELDDTGALVRDETGGPDPNGLL